METVSHLRVAVAPTGRPLRGLSPCTHRDKFGGGPVGLNTIAAAISEEKDAIEDIYEPFLIQIGFLDRTPRGRVATRLAYEHFGLVQPNRQSPLLF